MRPGEHFTVELVFSDRVGENLGVDARPHHRWYHYPAMRPDECLLFRTFDNAATRRSPGG